MPSPASTVAVFVNYRTPHATIRAVQSIQASRSNPSHILVVDNASGDGSAEAIRQALPDAGLIIATDNAGFSAGCNAGIRQALALGARRVVLFNPDIDVPADTIGELERTLESDVAVGIVGPALVSCARPDEIQSLGIAYSPLTGRMRHLGCGDSWNALPSRAPRNVDGVSGCAMMIDRQVFDRIGFLEEAYFFGFEDLDFCLRARAAGYGTACAPAAVVRHEGSMTIGRDSPRRLYFAARNHLLLAVRVSSSSTVLRRWPRAACIVGFNLAHALFTAPVPRVRGVNGFIRGVWDHCNGRYGRGPTFE